MNFFTHLLDKIKLKFFDSTFFLYIIGGLIFGTYVFLFCWSNFLLQGKIDSVMDAFPSTLPFLVVIGYLLFLLFAISLWWTWRKCKKEQISKKNWVVAFFFFFLFSLILFLTSPIFSQDPFWYLFQGRILVFYKENPYEKTLLEFEGDQFLERIRYWKDWKMSQGPLWLGILALANFLFPHSIFLQLFFLRFFLFIIFLSLIFLVITYIKKINPKLTFFSFLFLAWNPFLLFFVVNSAHSDILVAFLIFLAIYFAGKQKYLSSFLSLIGGVLIKYIPVFIVPFILKFIISRENKKNTEKIFIPVVIGITIVFFFLLFLLGGQSSIIFRKESGINSQIQLFSLYSSSPLLFWLTIINIKPLIHSTISTIGANSHFKDALALLSGGISVPWLTLKDSLSYQINLIRLISLIIFFVFYLWIFFQPLYQEEQLLRNVFLVLSGFLLCSPFWLMAWYAIWLAPLVPFMNEKIIFLTLLSLFLLFPYPMLKFQLFMPFVLLVFLMLFRKKTKK